MDKANGSRQLHSDDEIDLTLILKRLLRNYKLIGGTALVFAAVTAFLALYVMSPLYESFSVITPAQDQSMASRLGTPGSGSSIMQFLNFGMSGQEVTQFHELLKSSALVGKVVDKAELVKILNVPVSDEPLGEKKAKALLVKNLQDGVLLTLEGNFLKLEYRHTNPQIAHLVVSTYLDELSIALQDSVTTSAKSTQEFIEERLIEAQTKLSQIEATYLALQNSEGVVELPSQLSLTLNTASQLRSRLIEKEMEIELYRNVMRDSGEIQRLESEKAQIQRQLNRLIEGRKSKTKNKKGNEKVQIFTPLEEGASLSFQFATAERDYVTHVRIVDLLQQQLELARIETKKQEPKFQVIDPPTVGLFPVAPNKRLLTIIAFMLGILVSSLFVLISSSMRKLPKPLYRIVRVDVEARDQRQQAAFRE